MQVRAAGESGVAGKAQLLAHAHALARRHLRALPLQVCIDAHAAIAVQHAHRVGAIVKALHVQSIAVEVALDLHHDAIACGDYRRAFVGRQIIGIRRLCIGMREMTAWAMGQSEAALWQRD